MWTFLLTALPLALSAAALTLSVLGWRRTTRLDRWRHAGSVSVYETSVTGQITESNHSRIVVRNDGDSVVQVLNLSVAYGTWWVHDRKKPETWATITVPLNGPLLPGAELECASPDPVAGHGYIGPIVSIEDVNARRWLITRVDKRPLASPNRPPRRRDAWFEKQTWWRRLDLSLTKRARKAVERSPNRWHPLPDLIDFMWGWRPGANQPGAGPRNAPRAWRYLNTSDLWTTPSIDHRPRYSWRD